MRRWLSELIYPLIGLLLLANPSVGEAAPQARLVFGPETFARSTSAPAVEARTFAVPSIIAGPLTLQILNGSAPTGADRVTAAWVTVDGREVLGPDDFKKSVDTIREQIRLSPGPHILTVRLAGGPGTALRLSISGTIPLPDLTAARTGHTATLLRDGRVLIAAGRGESGGPGTFELFDASTLSFSAVGGVFMSSREGHSATLMPDGRVFLAKGRDTGGALSNAESCLVALSACAPIANLGLARSGHTATLLPNGRVLLAGGSDGSGAPLSTVELFDPTPDPFSDDAYDSSRGRFVRWTQALVQPRVGHTATLLPDGRILIAGGFGPDDELASAEVLNPADGTTTALASGLSTPRAGHTATLRPDGTVLIAGGFAHGTALGSLEVFDPATERFHPLAQALLVTRAGHTATLLPDGEILVSGGENATGILAHTELVGPPADDAVAPRALAIVPSNAATGVDRAAVITVRLSEPMDARSVSTASVRLTASGDVPGWAGIGENGLYVSFVPLAPLAPGVEHTLTLEGLHDLAAHELAALSVRFTTVTRPEVWSLEPTEGPAGTLVTLTGAHFAPSVEGNRLTLGGAPVVALSATTTTLSFMVPADLLVGAHLLTVRTRGGLADAAPSFMVVPSGPAVTALTIFPRGISLSVGGGQSFIATAHYADGPSQDVTAEVRWTSSDNAVASMSQSGRVTATGAGVASVIASLGGASVGASVRVFEGDAIPTDPSLVAPPLSDTSATTFSEATRFLYEGENPIQRDVAPGAIDTRRVAVLRGLVRAPDGAPLAGARVTLPGHPDLGYTLSRFDGAFDLAANGGGLLIVHVELDGYLPVERHLTPQWRDYAQVEEIVMTPVDPAVTAVDLSTAIAPQVARGSIVTDDDGTRRAAIVFAPGTVATAELPDGTARPLSHISVRATEYTVGASGPKAMPASLPATSAYTYAIEYSIDEADAIGAKSIAFTQPVVTYTDNFLRFPPGTVVPVADYDAVKHAWAPAEDGRVITIVAAAGGLADIDVDGTGGASSPAALAALGITDSERATLAGLYEPGQSLWRVRVTHFSTKDYNWPFSGPDGSGPPTGPGPEGGVNDDTDDPNCENGSIIECQNQGLGETIPLVGTAFDLHYRSSRAPRRRSAYTVSGTLSGSTVPTPLKRIELIISVAGHEHTQTFPPQPNQRYRYTWDGNDAYGRKVEGTVQATVKIGYVYDGSYSSARSGAGNSFGMPGGPPITSDAMRGEVIYWQLNTATLGTLSMGAASGNGWSFGIHHAYDPASGILYYGDGRRQSMSSVPLSITTVAGTPFGGLQNGATPITPARQLTLTRPQGLVASADGSFYVSNGTSAGGVGPTYRIDAAGQVQQIAAAAAGRVQATGPDGSLYFIDTIADVVRRQTPDGQLAVFAGIAGQSGFTGDGGPATAAKLSDPIDVVVARDGAVYISDSSNNRIRRVALDGTIATFAGGGTTTFNEAAGPALQARFSGLRGIAMAPDGSVYAAAFFENRVYRISPDGLIRKVAGGSTFFPSEGIPATTAALNHPNEVQVAPDSTFYITEVDGSRVRRVDTTGTISTVSATGGFGSEGTVASNGLSGKPQEVAVSPDGGLLVTEWGTSIYRVRRIGSSRREASSGQLLVPSADGAEAYTFDGSGRHLQTREGLTGDVLFTFEYDDDGRLIGIVDQNSQRTEIERTGPRLLGVVAPGGIRTALLSDSDGKLLSVVGPGGQTWELEYQADGLLASLQYPNGGLSHFTYDTDGRMVSDENAESGLTQLAFSRENSIGTTELTTPEQRRRTFLIQRQSNGDVLRTDTDAAGLQTTTVEGRNGSRTITSPDGTRTTITQGWDPRWSTQVRFAQNITIRTPSGAQLSLTGSRQVQYETPGNPLDVSSDYTFMNGSILQTSFGYDSATRTVRETMGTRLYKTVLDGAGRPVQFSFGNLTPSQFSYDADGHLTQILRGSRRVTIAYDARHRPSVVTDPLNHEIRFEYDEAGRIVAQAAGGRVTRFTYDDNGNVTSVSPPGRPAHTFAFTPLDLVSTYQPPQIAIGGSTTYRYDWDRQILGINRPDGQTIGFDYDPGGRLARVSFSRGDLEFGYDTAGRLSGITAPDGADLQFSYDGFLPTAERWRGAVEGVVERTFGTDLLVRTERVDGAHEVTYSFYDPNGLPGIVGELSVTRDPDTAEVTRTWLRGTYESRSYNSLGELAQLNAPGYSAFYTRDPLGRITRLWEFAGEAERIWDYAYDEVGRLQAVQRNGALVVAYTYDPNGNRMRAEGEAGVVTSTYDDQDRLLTYGDATYTYTPNGELATKTTPVGVTRYTYDTLGNLTRVALPDGRVITYLIDGRNRRVTKLIDGVRVRGWLYADQLRPIAELDGTGVLVARFVYASRPNVPDYFIKSGTTYRLSVDHLGSPRAVVDVGTGEAMQRLDFGAFGEVVQDTHPEFQPFGYAGGLYDPDTGLVRFGARDYDAETGRWTRRDPIGFLGGDSNLFTYSLSNPVNLADPNGLIVPLVAAAAIVGAAVGASIYAVTADSFSWQGLAGAAAGGAIAGGVGAIAAPLAASLGLGTGISGAAMVTAAAGVAAGLANAAIDPCLEGSARFLASSAAFGALGGTIGQQAFPTKGMSVFGQRGFPRTWSGVVPRTLGGNAGPNALNGIYAGGSVSVGVGAAGPVYVK